MSRVLTLFIVLIIQLKIFYALHVRNICQLPISRCTSRSFTTTPTSLFTTITNDFDSKNNNKQPDNKSILTSLRSASSQLSTQFNLSLADAKLHPFKYLSIPIAAALIGYITNYIGVKMLFYPIKMRGLIFQQWDAQPLAMFGWQGIVPAKRVIMSSRLVDVTLSKLLNIPALFQQLNPTQVSNLLINSLGPAVALFPRFITRFFLKRACADIIINAERVVDLKTLVVNGLTQDPTVLGAFFQRVAHKELQFLIDSGFGFGFLLGLLQMVQWMVYPKEWTLVAGRFSCPSYFIIVL